MSTRFSTVLLDLDNTLFDFGASEVGALEASLRHVGIDPTPEVFAVYEPINRALWDAVERGEFGPDDVRYVRFERLAEALGADFDPVAVGDHFVHGLGYHGDLFPGAHEVLTRLASTASLAMATNGLSDVQRAKIERLDLAKYFDAIVISAEVGCAKPDPAFFDLVFEQLGQPDRSTALMVGDSFGSDMAGGRAAGISTCWYNLHAKPPAEPSLLDFEIRSLEDMVRLVTG